jgi:hypothetical protein
MPHALVKKKKKISSYIRKFRMGAAAKSYRRKGFWISLYMRKKFLSFLSVYHSASSLISSHEAATQIHSIQIYLIAGFVAGRC